MSALAALLVLSLLVGGCTSEPIRNLTAEVRFDGYRFYIRNCDSYDWTQCEVTVNDRYSARTERIEKGALYSVGAMFFADKNGVRFNPATHKVLTLTIVCRQGIWKGGLP